MHKREDKGKKTVWVYEEEDEGKTVGAREVWIARRKIKRRSRRNARQRGGVLAYVPLCISDGY